MEELKNHYKFYSEDIVIYYKGAVVVVIVW
jgi:hypothetical protein